MARSTCAACGSERLDVFLEMRSVPVHQDMVCGSLEEARSFPRGDLRLTLCNDCGLFSNAAFQAEAMRYSARYDNAQTYSTYYQACMVEVAEHLKAQHQLRGKTIIDIGCGKGEFLGLVCAQGVNRGLGIDPSYIGPDTAEGGATRFKTAFFDPQLCDTPPDLVCCRHVVEHIENPLDFLRKVRQVFRGSKGGVLYIETPNADPIFAQGRFWDMYYEHPSYFTPGVLARLLGMAGFQVIGEREIFGGQYLALEAASTSTTSDCPVMGQDERARLQALAAKFRDGFGQRVKRFRESAERLARRGGCVVWGAAAKGVTIANTVDPEAKFIKYLVDINPAKQGKFVPGSGHPIQPPDYLRADPPSGIINMNPNYLGEVREMVQKISPQIPILSVED